MAADPTVHRGILGWSNKRTGVEFYRIMPGGDTNGRHWRGHPDDPQRGALLVDEIDPRMQAEGREVLVVVAQDRFDHATIPAAEAAVRAVFAVPSWRVRLARWLLRDTAP